MTFEPGLSSITTKDCVEYREFLADPQPRGRWCAVRSRERWSSLWRPLEGPLSAAAQRQAVTVLRNLNAYLVDQNYFVGIKSGLPRINTGRSLTMDQVVFADEVQRSLADTSANRRLGFALRWIHATGLRLSEAVAAMRWVRYPPYADDAEPLEGWMLSVVGNGDKPREVPVPEEILGELARYLKSRGLDPGPEALSNRDVMLIGRAVDGAQRALALIDNSIDASDGIAAGTLYEQFKEFFELCADKLKAKGDARGGERFMPASTHGLRHSYASHAIAKGMPIEIAQQNLGHASLATVTVYVT